MNSLFKRCVCVGAAALLAVTGLSGCGKLDGTKTVATCNDEAIPLGVASFMARYQQMQVYSYYGQLMGGTGGMFDTVADEETGETYGDSMKSSVMDSLEELYILNQHVDDYDIALTDDEKTTIEEAAQAYIDGNDQTTLDKIAASKEDVAKLMELYTIQKKMRTAMTADVDREVTDEEAAQTSVSYVSFNLTVSDADGNTTDMDDDAKAEVKTKAETFLAKMKEQSDVAGADMDALAKEVDDTLSMSSGHFGADDTVMDDSIKEAVSGLADGTMVDSVLTSSDGTHYYVVRLDKTFDEEATESEKTTIVSEREDDAYNTLYDEWKEAATFSVDDKVWKQVKLTDSDVYELKAAETTEAAENTTTAEDTTAAESSSAE